MPELGVKVVIEAENRASGDLQDVRRQLDDVAQSAPRVNRGFYEVRQSVQALSADIVGRVNPALSGMVGAMNQTIFSSRSMVPAFAAVTVAVVGISAAVGDYLTRLKDTQDAQVRLNLAARGFDAGALRSELQSLSREWEGFRQNILKPLPRIFGGFGEGTFVESIIATLKAAISKPGAQTQAEIERFQDELRRQILTIEAPRGAAQGGLQFLEGEKALKGLAASYAEATDQLEEYRQANADLVGVLIQVAEANKVLINTQAQLERAAAQTRQEPADSLELIEANRQRAIRALELGNVAQIRAAQEAARRGALGIQQRISQPGAFGEPDFTTIAGITGTEQDAALAERRLRIEAERARIATMIVGLSQDEREARELARTEAERVLAIEEARRTGGDETLVTLKAQADTYNLLRERLGGAVGGLAQGFRDAADEGENSFKLMETAARRSAENVQQAWSEGFFDVITGQFKKLPDIAKQFTDAMLRTVTQALATAVTAPLTRTLAGVLGGGTTGAPRLGALIGAGGVGGGLLTPGLARGAVPTSGYGAAGAPMTTGAGGAPSGGIGLPLPPIGSLVPTTSYLSAVLNTPP